MFCFMQWLLWHQQSCRAWYVKPNGTIAWFPKLFRFSRFRKVRYSAWIDIPPLLPTEPNISVISHGQSYYKKVYSSLQRNEISSENSCALIDCSETFLTPLVELSEKFYELTQILDWTQLQGRHTQSKIWKMTCIRSMLLAVDYKLTLDCFIFDDTRSSKCGTKPVTFLLGI